MVQVPEGAIVDPLGSSPLSLIVMTHTFSPFLSQASRTYGLRFILSRCSSATHTLDKLEVPAARHAVLPFPV